MPSRFKPKVRGQPASWRTAGHAARKQWSELRELASLTAEQISRYAVNGFRDLPGDCPSAETRRKLTELVTCSGPLHPMSDSGVWLATRRSSPSG
jgi:hypothetical protein